MIPEFLFLFLCCFSGGLSYPCVLVLRLLVARKSAESKKKKKRYWPLDCFKICLQFSEKVCDSQISALPYCCALLRRQGQAVWNREVGPIGSSWQWVQPVPYDVQLHLYQKLMVTSPPLGESFFSPGLQAEI